MPFEIEVDHEKRRTHCRFTGKLTGGLVAEYQVVIREQSGIGGYDEVVDFLGVTGSNIKAGDVDSSVNRAVAMDTDRRPGRFAMVAPNNLAYGMSRMYQSKRAISQDISREMRVFSDLGEAMCWLDGHESGD